MTQCISHGTLKPNHMHSLAFCAHYHFTIKCNSCWIYFRSHSGLPHRLCVLSLFLRFFFHLPTSRPLRPACSHQSIDGIGYNCSDWFHICARTLTPCMGWWYCCIWTVPLNLSQRARVHILRVQALCVHILCFIDFCGGYLVGVEW